MGSWEKGKDLKSLLPNVLCCEVKDADFGLDCYHNDCEPPTTDYQSACINEQQRRYYYKRLFWYIYEKLGSKVFTNPVTIMAWSNVEKFASL